MHVRVVEARHDEMPAEIDDLRAAPLQLADVVVGADGDDAPSRTAIACARSRRRLGVDVAIDEDGVGRGFAQRQTRVRKECGFMKVVSIRKASSSTISFFGDSGTAPASAAEFASGPDRGPRDRTTRAWCARRLRCRPRRWRSPPVPATAECWRRSKRAECAHVLPSCASTARIIFSSCESAGRSAAGRLPIILHLGGQQLLLLAAGGLGDTVVHRFAQRALQAVEFLDRGGTRVHAHGGRLRNGVHRRAALMFRC